MSENATTGLEKDSKGRGGIRYVETRDRQPVRVDSYLIPLSEIAKYPGDRVGLCYWSFSPNPVQTVNSVGYEPTDEAYASRERKPFMEKVIEEHDVRYPVGTNTSSGDAYGIDGIPYAFLVDRTGRIRCHGWPDPQIVEEKVAEAVAT